MPNCRTFPYNDNEAFKNDLQRFKDNNNKQGAEYSVGFLTLGKSGWRSMAQVFKDNQSFNIYIDGVADVQKEEQAWMNRVNATLSTNALDYKKL
jgi:hypothetical protein